ncbi:MAG: DUF4263 domain-containing protein [Rickettsiales bacterium]|nr:DUF4263 domain-containing protein [Rickettsiales bacterium]
MRVYRWVSQCLAQKTKWSEGHNGKNLVIGNTIVNPIKVRTLDPKALFIIGNKSFKHFRRNNRNLDIITFDELYDRAYFIVNSELESNKDTSN